MHVRFLFGPAGSGKTHRCLSEIREELVRSPEGRDLILLAPKQATFQLERQLLAGGSVRGYTRLQILSFERLAVHIFDRVGKPLPELLSEEGRVMVLRAILEAHLSKLRVFRASARLSGFARQLSALLRELQRRRIGPHTLEQLANSNNLSASLADKLSDLAMILLAYRDWIANDGTDRLEDAPRLLDAAVDALKQAGPKPDIDGLWLDGFAEMTPQEQSLLAVVLPHCKRATLAFCLPHTPRESESWLSPWAVVSETANESLLHARNLPDAEIEIEQLDCNPDRSRFSDAPLLATLERVLSGTPQGASRVSPDNQISEAVTGEPEPQARHQKHARGDAPPLRLVQCANMDAEAALAAREILSFVRDGNRFRDCAVLVRSLDGYQDVLRRILTRYGIPFFLDRREPVSHHPLAELTRFALRTATFDWRVDDWLGALKTGLAGLDDYEVDQLENAALSRGWEGSALWLNPLPQDTDLPNRDWLEEHRGRIIQPFVHLLEALRTVEWNPTGSQLASMIRNVWQDLNVETRLDNWAQSTTGGSVQSTVWEQMNNWLDNLERAFRGVPLPMREWLQIIEAGLSGLSVGVVPPALDQVLVGSVDRSRNPDLKLALVLGANEGVFPAPPPPVSLLNEAELENLEMQGVRVGTGRRQFGHERYLGYIALTRARERVVVSWSATDAKGNTQNPSRLIDDVKRAHPDLKTEQFDGTVSWNASQHPTELAAAFLTDTLPDELEPLRELPSVQPVIDHWREVTTALDQNALSPQVVAALYGNNLSLSVTALEAFASCPFRFFAAYGLGAREREEFEVDDRQMGTFQHDVLAAFHQRVIDSGKRWRELDVRQAAQWVREIGEAQLATYQHGLMLANAGRAFHARALLRNLECVAGTLTQWSRQNDFEPAAVEVGFGLDDQGWPGWILDLGRGRSLMLRGRVDRVDLLKANDGAAAVAILDYKSGKKMFDDLKFANGLQLQMPAYLNAICASTEAGRSLKASTLHPAGMFYVGLRSRPESGKSRDDATDKGDTVAVSAFQHRGRFDASYIRRFDTSDATRGKQFRFSFNRNGSLSKKGNDGLPENKFAALLTAATDQIRELSGRILQGEATVSPYRKGREVACGICPFISVCRFDSWTQDYRMLKQRVTDSEEPEGMT